MKIEKDFLITIGFILCMIVFFIFIMFLVEVDLANSKDTPLTGKTIIDHEASTMIYNEHHVGVSSRVEKSECRKCLDWYPLDDCKLNNLCLDVNSND